MELVLRDLAMADIELGRISSAAVDLCVAFLLRGTKFVEAMEVTFTYCALCLVYCAKNVLCLVGTLDVCCRTGS